MESPQCSSSHSFFLLCFLVLSVVDIGNLFCLLDIKLQIVKRFFFFLLESRQNFSKDSNEKVCDSPLYRCLTACAKC